jgi:hypothetical protein
MTPREFAAKAADCAAFAARPLDVTTAARLTATVSQLESLPDVAALLEIFTPLDEESWC